MKIAHCPWCNNDDVPDHVHGSWAWSCEKCWFTGPSDDTNASKWNAIATLIAKGRAWGRYTDEPAEPGTAGERESARLDAMEAEELKKVGLDGVAL